MKKDVFCESYDLETDEDIIQKIIQKTIEPYNLEKHLTDLERCVRLRRKYFCEVLNVNIDTDLHYIGYEYDRVYKTCCENVIGFVTIPVGLGGPIILNGEPYYVPLATTEGCLVASVNRGARCSAICGIKGVLVDDGMTRAPVIRTKTVTTSILVKKWLDNHNNFLKIKQIFDGTSRFARLKSIHTILSGIFIYVRFKATTGNAMGMNMISIGVEACLNLIAAEFGDAIEILSLSGNLCSDKKPTAINWIEGRGKSVICEAIIPEDVLQKRLHVTAEKLTEVNISKNLVGSAMAGSIGGNNANAANIVAAIFASTGQDLAQVTESSNCITYMETRGKDLYISCTMPCIEVGIVGGGTNLSSQSSNLKIIGLDRDSQTNTSVNFALVICSTVLCCELSLLASLATGTLVKSHLVYNRSKDRLSEISNNNSIS